MNLIFRTLVIATAILLAACSTTKPEAPSAALESIPTTAEAFGPTIGARAVLRWNNLIGGKFDDAYEMLSPGYRQTHDKKEYGEILRNRPVRWTKATFVDHACESKDVCTLRLNISFELMLPAVGTVPSENIVEEKWLNADGQWFFLPTSVGK